MAKQTRKHKLKPYMKVHKHLLSNSDEIPATTQ